MIEYIGDGVYVSYDGYGIEIRVNSHTNPPVAYLEPSVLKALMEFYERKKQK